MDYALISKMNQTNFNLKFKDTKIENDDLKMKLLNPIPKRVVF